MTNNCQNSRRSSNAVPVISKKSLELLPPDDMGRGVDSDRDLDRRRPSSDDTDMEEEEEEDDTECRGADASDASAKAASSSLWRLSADVAGRRLALLDAGCVRWLRVGDDDGLPGRTVLIVLALERALTAGRMSALLSSSGTGM